MTVTPIIDPARLLEEQLAQASPDLLRQLLTTFLNTLMSAQADSVCGAEYGQSSPDRVNMRNGYRDRLVQSLGITGLSKSQVSEMAKDLDAQVEAFRTGPLGDAGPFTGRRRPGPEGP